MKNLRNLFFLAAAFILAQTSYGQNALDFDGVDDYVETTFPGVLGGSTPITVEAWIKHSSNAIPQIITDWGANATGARFTFRLQDVGGTSDVLRIEISGSGMNGTINVGDNAWHHVAVVYDPTATSNYSLYVDGVLDVQGNMSTSLNLQAVSNMRIGQRMATMQPHNFDGAIEEVRVWNVARSLSQIIADTSTEYCQPQAGLVAYHRFNSGTASGTNTNDTISNDDSGLGNNGVLHGFALSGTSSNWITGKLTPCTPPSCLSPTNLGTTNVLGASADVYWTKSNSSSTIKVEYGTAGFTIGQGTKLTPTNDTISLTGLSSQTSYDIYVKEICSATDSSAWSMISFTTGCGLITTFPYVETFDASPWVGGSSSYNTGAVLDPCWSRVPDFASNTYSWGPRATFSYTGNTGPTTGFGGSGNFVYTEASYGTTGDGANFVTPDFDFSSLNTPQLTFQAHMYGSNIGSLSIWAWNGVAYDTVLTISGNQGDIWKEISVNLGAYQNMVSHLVFHAERGNGFQSDIAIDQVQIDEAPLCAKPSAVYFSNITSNSADIHFTSTGTEFDVEYGPVGFVQGTGPITTILASGATISGLGSNTTYEFYLRNNCSDSLKGVSTWAGPFTIQTLCSYTNAYFSNWDLLNNGESDACWTLTQFGTNSAFAQAYTPPASATLQPFSGVNFYAYSNMLASEVFLVSPEITDLPLNTLQIRFQATDVYAGTLGTPSIFIGTMASPGDTTSYVVIDTVETVTNVWTEFTVQLSNVPANHRFVTLRHSANANVVELALDDLSIEIIPSCVAPSLGEFSQVLDTSAVLDWIAGDASTFEIEYGIAGFVQGTGNMLTGLTDTNQALNGLAGGTCYDVYIRGNCTNSNSPWYGPISFCTKCTSNTAPYMENFDDTTWVTSTGSLNKVNDCWSRTPTSYNTYRWEAGSGSTITANTGPASDASGIGKYVFIESTGGVQGQNALLETPVINFSSLATPTLGFAYHMYGATTEDLYVLISNGGAFDTLQVISGEQQTSSTEDWKRAYIDISTYANAPRIIQFIGVRGSSYTGDIAIDEIFIDEMPTCLIPTNFALDTVTATSADFNWISASNGTAFKFEYGPAGFTQGTGSGTTVYNSGSPATITGLTPNTSYDIYLTDLCDSTNWVGPITFTTLKTIDVELTALISPSQLNCGDSAMAVEVRVTNLGVNAISNFGISANITGAATATITTTFINSLAPGASADVVIDNINAYMGGLINVEAFTNLTGDQETSNDTLIMNNVELIAAVPLHMPVDTLCTGDTTGQFIAIPQTGIINNWYNNMADVTPFATGDTIPAMPAQTVYLDRSKEVDQTVIDAQNTSSQFGNMFKLYIKEDILFTGFSFEAASSGAGEPIAFYKSGNFVGHETAPADWTPIDSMSMTVVSNSWYTLNFATPVQFTAGDTVSLYLANKQGTKIRWENLSSLNAVGDLYLNNADFEYYAGVTGAYFGTNMTTGNPRAVSSIIHYSSTEVCGNNRIALTMGVNNDVASASFVSNINTNGADVDFDASASTGQVFEWNFGDGNMGTGMMPMHTYASGGNYTVTLIVTDTICGTTDTISDLVMPFVSIEESLLSRSLNVYPNPNSGAFKISFDVAGIQEIELAVLNTIGQVVYQENVGTVAGTFTRELAIENLAPGVYFLRVMANGKPTNVKMSVL